mmetsp:Transcript_26679/g.52563  ORF Transcript_26679/g.52563 Transcript_26679/m.52563 type:complete len:166 (+) Transcript_26679:956-1453(+)
MFSFTTSFIFIHMRTAVPQLRAWAKLPCELPAYVWGSMDQRPSVWSWSPIVPGSCQLDDPALEHFCQLHMKITHLDTSFDAPTMPTPNQLGSEEPTGAQKTTILSNTHQPNSVEHRVWNIWLVCVYFLQPDLVLVHAPTPLADVLALIPVTCIPLLSEFLESVLC